jgi:hypothetical protein
VVRKRPSGLVGKNTLDTTGEAGLAYILWNKVTLGFLSKLAQHLCALVPPRPDPSLPKVPRAPQARRKGQLGSHPHQFVWYMERWTCTECGCSKKGISSKLDGRSCQSTQRVTKHAHDSHALHIGWLKGNVPLVFCTRCSCYTTSNSVGLRLLCRPSGKGKKTIHSRLCGGLHPVSKAPFLGTIRLPNFRLHLGSSLGSSCDVAIGPSGSGGDTWGPSTLGEDLPHDQLGLGGNWPEGEGGSPSNWDPEAADFLFV